MIRLLAGLAGATSRLRSDERLFVICGSTVLVMAGQGIVAPILPLFADNFGASAALVGLTFTAFGLARLLLNIPAGIWADRRGRRFLLIGGPLLTAVGMLGSGLAPTIWILLAWLFVAGAGSAIYNIASENERGRYIATNQRGPLVGASAWPAIGRLLAESYGFRAPFLSSPPEGRSPRCTTGFDRPNQRPSASTITSKGRDRDRDRDRSRTPCERAASVVLSVKAGHRSWPGEHVDLLDARISSIAHPSVRPRRVRTRYRRHRTDLHRCKSTIVPAGYFASVGVISAAFAPNGTWFVGGLCCSRQAAMGAYRSRGDLGIVMSPPLSGLLADVGSIPWVLFANGLLLSAATRQISGRLRCARLLS